MKVDLKNDTLLVKYNGMWETAQLASKIAESGLVLPEGVMTPSVDPNKIGYSQVPVLMGEITQIGPGKKIRGEGRFMSPDMEVGKKVMFQVQSQIAFRDKKTSDIYYIIGAGNVLAFVEE